MSVNVWERAVYFVSSMQDDSSEARALYEDMLRVECVEGEWEDLGDDSWIWHDPGADCRPALLLVLPEEER